MKIAFDVAGTIEGPKQKEILELFWRLHGAGHELFVWSNSYGYAIDAVKKYNLPAATMLKYGRGDSQDLMDVAIEDDRSQTWLGASKIVFVDELSNKSEFLDQLTKGSK
jgi:hypothetical protein